MNRRIGIILPIIGALVIGGCASAGSSGPDGNRWTRDAERELALAMLRQDPAEKAPHLEEALRVAEEGLEQRPDNANLWLVKGQALAGLGQYEEAHEALSRAEELSPELVDEIAIEREQAWVEAYNDAAEALRQDRIQDAIELFEQTDRIYPVRPDARVILGWLYEREGETALAIQSYQRALDVLQQPPPEEFGEEQLQEWQDNLEAATFQLARLLSTAGRHDEAVAVYSGFLEVHPEHVEAHLNLALALGEAGRAEEANQVLAEVLSEDLSEMQLFMVGVGLFQADEHDRAAEAFERVLSANQYSRDAAYNLAQAHFVRAGEMESRLEGASRAEAQQIRGELMRTYQSMFDAADAALNLDPYNRNVLLLKVTASRGLMEQAESASDRQRKQQQTVSLLERYEEMDIDVVDVGIRSSPGGISVHGTLENLGLQEGTDIQLRFTFYGPGGRQLGSEAVTVQAPPREQRTSFEVAAAVDNEVTGWRYERVN